jgi:integrase
MPQAKKLTPVSVANAKPGKTRREISDGGSGLWLIVQPSGRLSWAARYRLNGKPQKLTLAATSLADARRQAAEALHEVAQGRDPAAGKITAKKAKAERAGDTVESLAAEFLEKHAKRKTRPASWQQAERVFRKEVLPAWAGRTVHEIRKRDVVSLVEGIAEDRPILANRALEHVRGWFNWMLARDVVDKSPCIGIKPPSEEVSRDRVLTDDEIKQLWLASDIVGDPFGAFVKTLLLTGQRRSEVAAMRWSEIKEGLWTLPAERNKAGEVHVVPLPAQVNAILAGLNRIGTTYVFTTTGDAGISGFSRGKRRIDKRMRPAAEWRLHDLRRTCASGLQRLGVPIHVTEAVLGHRSGTLAGIARVYQRHDYLPEKTVALQRWADQVERLVGGKPAKVVQLHGR